LYGSETWRLKENNKRRFEATEMDVLRRSSRISRKERIRNVTIRHQTGLEEPIIKEIEQNQLIRYGHVQRMAEGRLPRKALKWISMNNKAISACLLSAVFCLRESTVIFGATRLSKSVHYLTYLVVFCLQISTLTEQQKSVGEST